MRNHNHQKAIRSAKKGLTCDESISGMAEIFKILGDQTRLKIVLALGHLASAPFAEDAATRQTAKRREDGFLLPR
jgi:hypothetical protein